MFLFKVVVLQASLQPLKQVSKTGSVIGSGEDGNSRK